MSRRRIVRGALRTAMYLLVLGFLAERLWSARHGLAANVQTIGPANMVLAGAIAGIGGVPGMFGWRVLLAGMGTRLKLPVALRVYFLGGLARYLPGGVWPAVAHAAMARPLREPPGRLAAAFLASQALAVVAGLAVGLLSLPTLVMADPRWWILLPALLGSLVLLAEPRLLRAALSPAARLLRRGAPPTLPDRRTLLTATGLMVFGWLISGIHIAILAIALGADTVAAGTVGIGGFALSVVAGVLSIVLPSGLGARELVLGLTLATLLSGPALVTVVAVSRVLITITDVASTAIVLGFLAWPGRAARRAAHPVQPTPSEEVPYEIH